MKSVLVLFWVLVSGYLALASDSQVSSTPSPSVKGYRFCSRGDSGEPAATYLDLCHQQKSGVLTCGLEIAVVRRHGPFLEFVLADGIPRYVVATAISQRPEKFVPFGLDSGIADAGLPDCSTPPDQFLSKDRLSGPRAIYSPQPGYSDQARKMKVQGTIVMSLTVGADGLPRDVKIERGLGYGLDEEALEAVRKWKFQPALKDGQPIEAKVHVQTTFRLF